MVKTRVDVRFYKGASLSDSPSDATISTSYNRMIIFIIFCGYVARSPIKSNFSLKHGVWGIHSARYLISHDKNTYIQLISVIGFLLLLFFLLMSVVIEQDVILIRHLRYTNEY